MVGLTRRVSRLDQVARGSALTTVVGPAGVGKTSLAKAWLRPREDAIFVDLCSATTEHDIVERIAAVVGLHLSNYDDDEAAQAVGRVLQGRATVLDNLEQAAEPAGVLLSGWLKDGVEGLVCTSRQPLFIAGEVIHELETLSADEAASLLARLAGVPVDQGVAELVAALDYLPLAIHLAAPLCGLLSPGALAKRVRARSALGFHQRGADPRHRSMEAALRSSWERLEPIEQRTLSALTLFESEFSLETAEALLGPGGPDALGLLAGLKSKSLVQTSVGTDFPALRLLVSTRHFVRQQQEPTDEDRRRLRSFFAEAGERADRALLGGRAEGRRFLQRHWPDVRGIVEATADADLLARWRKYLATTTPRRRWTSLFERTLNETDQAPTHQTLLLRSSMAGGYLNLYGPERALESAQAMLAVASQHGFDQAGGVAKSVICECLCRMGRMDEARTTIVEALDVLVEPLARAIAYRRLAWIKHQLGEPSQAETHASEALCREHQLSLLLAPLLAQRGLTEPNPERSKAHLDEAAKLALAYDGSPGWLWGVTHSYGTLAGLSFADWERAAGHAAAFERSASASADTSVAALGVAARILGSIAGGGVIEASDRAAAERLVVEAAPLYRTYPRAALMVEALYQWDLGRARGHARQVCEAEGVRHIERVGAAYLALLDLLEGVEGADGRLDGDEDDHGVWAAVRAVAAGAEPSLNAVPPNKRYWVSVAVLAEACGSSVLVRADGTTVRSLHGEHSLARRPVPRRILVALLQQRRAHPGAPLDSKALIAAGWPNERMKVSSAKNRLYTQVRVLRGDGGLGERLVSGGAGYFLDPRRVRVEGD